jgi:AGZA family xanthine/uracil permease-like MFS transporter
MQVEKTNMAVAKSFVGRRFRLEFSGHRHERKGSRFLTEIRAGLATFFAMAYIISVNASITASKSLPTYNTEAQTNAIFSKRRYLCL